MHRLHYIHAQSHIYQKKNVSDCTKVNESCYFFYKNCNVCQHVRPVKSV